MPCVVCREVVVSAVCATVHATDDYLRWASSHCARTPATANGDLAQVEERILAGVIHFTTQERLDVCLC